MSRFTAAHYTRSQFGVDAGCVPHYCARVLTMMQHMKRRGGRSPGRLLGMGPTIVFGVFGIGVFLVLLPARTSAAAAGPEPARQQYEHALGQLRLGNPAAAAAEFEASADDAALAPDLAAEALFRAAQIEDEQLGHPAVARDLYARLAQRFPGSRFAGRAQERRDELAALVHTDAVALAEFNQIASAYLTLGAPTVIARLQQLLTAYPDFPQADRATYLLGTAYRDAGPRYADTAAATLRRVLTRHPRSPWVPYAQQALADLALQRDDYREAQKRYQALLAYPQPMWQEAGHKGLSSCTQRAWRRRAALASWLYLLGLSGVLLLRARRRLWPLPLEALYYAPVGALLLLLTLAGHAVHARATMSGLSLGGLLLCWLSGAAGRQPGGLLVGLVSRVLAAIALCYVAVYYGGLLDLLIETWRMGPQSG
jgi:outer membrane protein assembly factor BamD (BamD/ComL family)